MCCGTSYLRLIDFCITQLQAQGPCRTCNESKEENLSDRGGSGSSPVDRALPNGSPWESAEGQTWSGSRVKQLLYKSVQ